MTKLNAIYDYIVEGAKTLFFATFLSIKQIFRQILSKSISLSLFIVIICYGIVYSSVDSLENIERIESDYEHQKFTENQKKSENNKEIYEQQKEVFAIIEGIKNDYCE